MNPKEASELVSAYIKSTKNEVTYMRMITLCIQTIEQYNLDIANSKETIGVDLVKKGFCQGVVYKNALLEIDSLNEQIKKHEEEIAL